MATPDVGKASRAATEGHVPADIDPVVLRRRYATSVRPNPLLYYFDMLASAATGWTAFAVAVHATRFSAVWFLAFWVAVFALYRAVLFIHELSHLARRAVPGFEVVWSLVVGLPMLVPSLMYVGSHGEHHRQVIFGTDKDPEYVPMGTWSRLRVFASSIPLFFVPAALVLRWGLFGPLSYLVPPLRRLVVGYASTLVINPVFERRLPEGRNATRWHVEEAATALVCWAVAAAVWTGALSTSWCFEWYAISCTILVLNHVRTLVAHRYRNEDGPMGLLEQYLDSVNLSGGSALDVLLAPVGLRYHALHHLLPTVPYHALGQIHRRMMRELPEATPYRVAEFPTLFVALRTIFGPRSASAR